MNRIIFFIKFIFNTKSLKYLKFNSLFPMFGAILGVVVVLLTLSIMNGMEYSIFSKLRNVSFPSKITNLPEGEFYDGLKNLLKDNDIDFRIGINGKIMLQNNDNYRLVNVIGIDDFSTVSKKMFNHHIQSLNVNANEEHIYIGRALADKLHINLGDSIVLHSTRINFFSGLPYNSKFIVSGIYELEILEYDQKYIFSEYKYLYDLLNKNAKSLYLNKELNLNIRETLLVEFPDIKIENWDVEHLSFIAAMRVEKIIYSLVGVLIIGISAFTLLSMMSLSVMQKISQIAILRAIGYTEKNIMRMFLSQAFITWFLSCLIGSIVTRIILSIEKRFNIISYFFEESLLMKFPLIIKAENLLFVFIFSFFILILSALYPSIKASKLNIINALGYGR